MTGSLIGSFTFPVNVAGVATSATWSLEYQTSLSEFAAAPRWSRSPPPPPTIVVPVYTQAHLVKLTAIRLPNDVPGAPAYIFEYSGSAAGLLSKMTLPTGGSVEYTYDDYSFYHGRVGALEPGCQGPPKPAVLSAFEITSSNSSCSLESGPQPRPPKPAIPAGCSEDNLSRWLDVQTGVVRRKETVPGGPDGTVTGITDYVQFAFPFGERGTPAQVQPSQTLTIVIQPEVDKNGAASGRRTAKGVLFWGGPKNSFSGQVFPGDRTGADIEERIFDVTSTCFIPTGEIPMPACGGSSPQAFCSDKAVRVTQRGYEYDNNVSEAETGAFSRNDLLRASSDQWHLRRHLPLPFRQLRVGLELRSRRHEPMQLGIQRPALQRRDAQRTLGPGSSDQRTVTTAWNTGAWGVVPPGNGFALPNLMRKQVESYSGSLVVKRYFYFDTAKSFLNGTADWNQSGGTALLTCRYPNPVNDGTPRYEVYALQPRLPNRRRIRASPQSQAGRRSVRTARPSGRTSPSSRASSPRPRGW